MKKLNKKGFTIVELVIVIAVIAILAAVLIPTFATVIENANKNAVLQAARNAYTEDLAAFNGTYATTAAAATVNDYTLKGTIIFASGAVKAYLYAVDSRYDVVYFAEDITNNTAYPASAPNFTFASGSYKAGWTVVAKNAITYVPGT